MTFSFVLPLLVKMIATATLVIGAARLAEKHGPFWGAMVASLPVSAGPAYVFLAMDHSPEFLSEAALFTLTINMVTALFVIVYANLAQRFPLGIALPGAYAAWLAAMLILKALALPFIAIFVLNMLAYGIAIPLTMRFRGGAPPSPPPGRWWDIPLRAGLVMVIVGCVVGLSNLVGPRWTGVIAGLPVAFTCLVLVMHPRMGGKAAAAVLANAVPGLIGFALCLSTVAVLAVPLGPPLALFLALVVALSWNMGLMGLRFLRIRREMAA